MLYWFVEWVREKVREFMKDGCSGDCRQGRLPCNCQRGKR